MKVINILNALSYSFNEGRLEVCLKVHQTALIILARLRRITGEGKI